MFCLFTLVFRKNNETTGRTNEIVPLQNMLTFHAAKCFVSNSRAKEIYGLHGNE